MNERNNGRGIFYGVIGVATLVVAIIGATFAYFTASASNNATITGNMATVKLALSVEKVTTVDEEKKGMIPMSNGMVEKSVNSGNDVCVDDNGNAVCQIYKITLKNDSSAGQFVDGYVALKYGSGEPTDTTLAGISYVTEAKFDNTTKTLGGDNAVGTTMRWAQVFKGDGTAATNNATTADYSTGGVQQLGPAVAEKVTLTQIGAEAAAEQDSSQQRAAKAHNTANIRSTNTANSTATGILSSLAISGTTYNVIGSNYIRVSNHKWATSGDESYDRTVDATSALVFNHSIAANSQAEYYIVVWLSETGTNQTAGSGATTPTALNFFNGNVTFVSAQGSEVSATFSGYSRVDSQASQQG